MTWAHHALQHDNRKDFMTGLGITILLGMLFTGLQALEYSHAPFGLPMAYIHQFLYGYWISWFPRIGWYVVSGCLLDERSRWSLYPDPAFGFEAAAAVLAFC